MKKNVVLFIIIILMAVAVLLGVQHFGEEAQKPCSTWDPVNFTFGLDRIVTSQRVGAGGAKIKIENTGTPVDDVEVEILPDTFKRDHEVSVGYNNGTLIPAAGVYAGFAIVLKIDNKSYNGHEEYKYPIKITIPCKDMDKVPVPYYVAKSGNLHLAQTIRYVIEEGKFEIVTWIPEGYYLYILANP